MMVYTDRQKLRVYPEFMCANILSEVDVRDLVSSAAPCWRMWKPSMYELVHIAQIISSAQCGED